MHPKLNIRIDSLDRNNTAEQKIREENVGKEILALVYESMNQNETEDECVDRIAALSEKYGVDELDMIDLGKLIYQRAQIKRNEFREKFGFFPQRDPQ